MKPIKICFFSLYAYHYFNPKINSKFGGAELQLYYLAKELAKDQRFDVNFVVGDFGQPDFEIIQNVKIFKFFNPQKKLKYIRAIFNFIKLWQLLKKINADLYIQRAAGLETGGVSLFCKLNKKKFIYMVAHDLDIERKAQYGMSWWRWLVFKKALNWADLVISQHEDQKKALKNLYGKESIIRPSAHEIPEISDSLKKEIILWVARCEEWKGPEFFLEMAKHFPNEKFVMICPESNDKNYFEKIKKESSKISNLQFIDYVPFNEIDGYFQKAKVFINTSKSEGFPNTFIQAAKNKTPILSLLVNPDGMLERYQIGISANGDFERLKSGLKILLENKSLWQQMSENIYRYAKENHDLRKIIEKDKEVIINLINE